MFECQHHESITACVQCAEYRLLNVILIHDHYNVIIIETNVFM